MKIVAKVLCEHEAIGQLIEKELGRDAGLHGSRQRVGLARIEYGGGRRRRHGAARDHRHRIGKPLQRIERARKRLALVGVAQADGELGRREEAVGAVRIDGAGQRPGITVVAGRESPRWAGTRGRPEAGLNGVELQLSMVVIIERARDPVETRG